MRILAQQRSQVRNLETDHVFPCIEPMELFCSAHSNELYKDAAFPNDLVRQIVSDPTQINDLLLTAVQKDIALRGYSKPRLETVATTAA